MSKITYLTDLYKQSVKPLTANAESWKKLLSSMSRFYKRSFDNAVLIHVQNPNVTQLATFDEWHADKINRSINKGAKGLAVIDMSNPKASFKHYFDLMDTNGTPESFKKVVSYMWELELQYQPSLMIKFHEKYGVSMDSMEVAIYELVQLQVEERLRSRIDNFNVKDESSELYGMPLDVIREELKDIIVNSSYYMVASKAGLDTSFIDDTVFANIKNYGILQTFMEIGASVMYVSRPILKEINAEIDVIKFERSKVYEQRTISESNVHRGQGRIDVSEPRNLEQRTDRGSGQIRSDVERMDAHKSPRQSIGTSDDGRNQRSDYESQQRSGKSQGRVDTRTTENTTHATNREHPRESSPHGNVVPYSGRTDTSRGIIQSTIEDNKPFVDSYNKQSTDGFFVVPKSNKEAETNLSSHLPMLEEAEEIKLTSVFPVGTFVDYLNILFMYTGTDEEDRHIIRSLEEKNAAFSFTTEGLLEHLIKGDLEIVHDPAISSVFGFHAGDEVYIWNTKYKLIDFDSDEVIFQNDKNVNDIRKETLLDVLTYLDQCKNYEVEDHNNYIGQTVTVENTSYVIEKIDKEDVEPMVYLSAVDGKSDGSVEPLEYIKILLEEQNADNIVERDTRFDLEADEISELLNDFVRASDVEPSTLEFQSEICKFFLESHHKRSTKIDVVKAFYGKLDTSYTTDSGDYLEVVRADEKGLYFERGGQPFYMSFEHMTERIDRLVLEGLYPFSQEDIRIDDYAIPDEAYEMQGIIDDEVHTHMEEPQNEQINLFSLAPQTEPYEDTDTNHNDSIIIGDEQIEEHPYPIGTVVSFNDIDYRVVDYLHDGRTIKIENLMNDRGFQEERIPTERLDIWEIKSIPNEEELFVEILNFYEEHEVFKATFLFAGKEHTSGIIQQGDTHYVRVGSALGGDLQRINLSKEQVAEFYHFVNRENVSTAISEATFPVENGNYHYSSDHSLYEGGAKTKCRANIKAIRVLKQIENEHRIATPEEQITLAGYVGWGGLANALTPNKDGWQNEFEEIKSLLSEEELLSEQESTTTAYYTEQMIIENIYKALDRFGFESGNILDPAMGTGNFFSVLPDSMASSKLYGVELDSITGGIAKQLYPNADIKITGFEHTNFSDQFFDVALGNIPFNNISISDSKYNKYNFKIHDYFIAKSLDKVRPGGIVAFITSKGTMDKANPNVRKYIAQRAELIGAIRLPNNAFKKVAGTEVTSDILFFQKREMEVVPSRENAPWLTIEENEDGIPVNSYFIDHPEMILGKMVFDRSMYGDEKATACHPIEGDDLADRLDQVVHYLDGVYQEPTSEFEEEKENTSVSIDADSSVKNFSYTIFEDKVWYRENSRMYLQEIGGKKEERIRGQIYIHKALRDLIDYQTDDYVREHADADTYKENIEKKIAYLNHCYDEFVSKHGYLNLPVNISAFKRDSGAPLLRSVEKPHPSEDKVFEKTDMFYRPTIQNRQTPKVADNAHDALKMCLNERGRVDLLYIQKRYKNAEGERVPTHQIIEELGDLIYQDPELMGKDNNVSGYVLREEYLSGYVKDKLKIAIEVAQIDPERFHRNVEALQAVQPEPILSHEIEFTLGSTWIPLEVYEDFIYELCQTPFNLQDDRGIALEYSEYGNKWHISNKSIGNSSVITNSTYGTARVNAYEIIEDTLNLKKVEVRDREEYIDPRTGEEKVRYPLNRAETVLARSKQDELVFKFRDYLFKDPTRCTQMEDLYNDIFNNIVLRQYNGDDLTFPDMAENIKLRKHQRDVVAQGIYSGRNILMAHEVGSGKTFSSIALAYELKRIGIVNKPLIAVPNHLVRQWGAAYMALYPNANILVAEKKDFEKQNRKRFASRIAVSDYDAVIMAHSSFELIGLSPEYRLAAIKDELNEIVDAIAGMKREKSQDWGLKQMQIFKKNLQTRYDKLFKESKKDDALNFEELGVDCLTVDESHTYKNNFSYTKLSRIAGIGGKSSQRAMDMHMKVQYINAINEGRGVAYLTGTPIANSMSELYVIQKSLQPEDLKRAGLLMFDNWASTFGLITSSMEIKPEGGGYQIKNRFSTFHNIPELMTMFRLIADIKTSEQLPEIPVPALATGKIQVIKTKAAPTQEKWIKWFAEVAEKIRLGEISKEEFNFLQLTMMARQLAVDPRILDSEAPNDPDYKLNVCARKVAEIYHETANERLTQMIFCDQGTPKDDGKLAELRRKKGGLELEPHEKFDFYHATKQELINQGVDEKEIAFIHDYGTDLQKEQLYEKINRGEIRILIGSTAKCGTGMNIQQRLIALHHLDIPWRPSDLIQRNGRIIRQGNLNPEVSVFNYITEDTFDAYLYQILEQKQRYITQIMNGDKTIRKCEDMDETVLQYAEFKAMAISDPRIRIKMEVDNEISRLTILKSAYQSSLGSLKRDIANYYPKEIENTARLIEKSMVDVETYKAKKPIEFQMMIDGRFYDERAKAAEHLKVLLKKLPMTTGEAIKVGTYAGFDISVIRGLGFSASVLIQGERQYSIGIGDSILGAITRMENEVDKIPSHKEKSEYKLVDLKIQLENAKKEVDKPFPDEERLLELMKQKTELDLGLEFKTGGDSELCFDEVEGEEVQSSDLVLKNGVLMPQGTTVEQRLYSGISDFLHDFINGDRYYAKYKSEGFMDLVIENVYGNEYSIAHLYEQNGDRMRDPEITFILDTERKEIHPTSFLQDNMGVFYHVEGASKEKVDDLKSFMSMWFKNIHHQGYELFQEKNHEFEDERW
ncbi:MAG: DEAD/DEAH box helicase family protein [Lachnospiraceae bacterium]